MPPRVVMAESQKVLLLDDDQDLLEVYKEILSQLPSKPEIHTATSGARAIALLESDHFGLLVSDLNMPKMDGLQVLTIVRRKFPSLRTAVMTSVVDEQFRARAYSMGIDLFLEKPNTQQEITFFLDCIESLLGKQSAEGFRGVQSKSLVDIIQLECLSGSSSVMKIINGTSEGRIWLLNGEIIDAMTGGVDGEKAFQIISSWKTGNFEILPAEQGHVRTLFGSYQGLLLETAQALDESTGAQAAAAGDSPGNPAGKPLSKLAEFSRVSGVGFLLSVPSDPKATAETWGVANAPQSADWVRNTVDNFRSLGELLNAGPLQRVEMVGSEHHLAIVPREGMDLCVGFHRSLSMELARETLKTILTRWGS